jgi:ketol-acid reductoisomerase
MMAKNGMYSAFKNNASPTCQFGVASRIKDIFGPELQKNMEEAIDRITSGKFAWELAKEEEEGYPTVKNFFAEREFTVITETEKELMNLIKRPV